MTTLGHNQNTFAALTWIVLAVLLGAGILWQMVGNKHLELKKLQGISTSIIKTVEEATPLPSVIPEKFARPLNAPLDRVIGSILPVERTKFRAQQVWHSSLAMNFELCPVWLMGPCSRAGELVLAL